MSNQHVASWSSDTAMATLFMEMSEWINGVADCSSLRTALKATIEGHVAGHEFDKTVMVELTTGFATELEKLGAALSDTSTKLAALSWAFDDACSSVFGMTAQHTATNLNKLKDAAQASRAEYLERYAPRASRPVQCSVDQLLLELAVIFQRYSNAPPVGLRSNGQLMLNQIFVSLLENTWKVLPNVAGVRPSSAQALISRAKRSSAVLCSRADAHQPLYYRAVKN
jgi:hypothetical protein